MAMEVDQPASKRVKLESGLSLDGLSERVVDNSFFNSGHVAQPDITGK
jgi:hypothetical protein